MRLSRESYYLKIALVVAERSTCKRAKVGAILVNPKASQIVATGYNGSLPGAPHCIDQGCMEIEKHCRRTVHAEMNAVLHLEHRYQELHCYTTHQPCAACYKALVMANVKIVYIIFGFNIKAKIRVIRINVG